MDVQTELYLLKPQIENGTPLQLHWSGSRFITWVLAFVGFLPALFIGPKLMAGFEFNVLLAALLGLGLWAFTTYQFMYSATATLEGKKLTLKKIFRAEETINVSQIEKVSFFRMRDIAYSGITYKNTYGQTHRAVIHNSRSFLYGQEVPAAEIIKLAQSL